MQSLYMRRTRPGQLKLRATRSPSYRPTKLKAWREHRGFTLERLAEAVGTTHSTLSRWENGRHPYEQELLEKLATALQTTPGQIIDRDPPRDDDIWTIWYRAAPQQKRQIEAMAKALVDTLH